MTQKSDKKHYDVLLIDDNEMIQGVVTVLMQEAGFSITTCPNGPAAVALSREKAFKVYIIDYLLPEMRGDAVAAELRRLHSKAVIIGCSVEQNEHAFLSAGADKFILKENIHTELMPFIRESLSQN